MKVIIAVVGVMLLATAGVLWLDGAGATENDSDLQTAVLEVQGMQSLLCELGVRHSLMQLPGVEDVAVDRTEAVARATFDPTVVSTDQLVDAVNGIGYPTFLKSAGHAPAFLRSGTTDLSEEEIATVAEYVATHMLSSDEIPTGEDIAAATGVEVTRGDLPIVQSRVIARLMKDPAGRAVLEGSRCSDYGACSLFGNLSTASDKTLEMYVRERAEDGRTFDDFRLPTFEAFDLAGNTVHSTDLVGQPTLLAFLAVHCNHSIDSLPILQSLNDVYGPGLRVVAVFINSGSVDDLNYWVPMFDPRYEVWAYDDADLGDEIASHLVPTYLLIDGEGRITTKLVGFKEEREIRERLLSQFDSVQSGHQDPSETAPVPGCCSPGQPVG